MSELTLADLNAHLFASVRPSTHALDNPPESPAAAPRKGRAAAKPSLDKPREYTAEQLATLAAVGIDDPASKTADEIDAILAAVK